MEKIEINGQAYEIFKDEREAFEIDVVKERLTDYFNDFDVVVGDWAYGKLRLKGFNNKGHRNFKTINDASKIKEYIKKNCAYGCRWFEIRKIK